MLKSVRTVKITLKEKNAPIKHNKKSSFKKNHDQKYCVLIKVCQT